MKPVKNVVSLCLGQFIRQCRIALDLSYSEAANIIGVKASYLQTFEQGNTIFHIAKAFQLYRLVSSLYPKSLSGLIEIISVASIIESKANEKLDESIKDEIDKGIRFHIRVRNGAYIEGEILAFSALIKARNKLNRLYMYCFYPIIKLQKRISESIYTSKEEEDKASDLSSDTLAKYMEEFKNFIKDSDLYGVNEKEQELSSFSTLLDPLPTSYLPSIIGIRDSLRTIPNIVNGLSHSLWERANKKSFEEATFIVPSSWLEVGVLYDLYFNFLFEKKFSRLNLITYSDKPDRNFDYYYFNYFLMRTRVNRNPMFEYELEEINDDSLEKARHKIKFYSAKHDSVLNEILDPWNVRYNENRENMIIIYKILDGYSIGFIGSLELETELSMRSLNLGELKNILSKMNDITLVEQHNSD